MGAHESIRNSLAGQVALITGAGSGIGRATALLLSHAGARVGVLGNVADDVVQTCAQISAAGGEALPLPADITSADQLGRSVEAIQSSWHRLDIVVANAGINGLWAPVEHIGTADWQETMDVNLRGTFLTVQAAIPLLKKNGGSIVIVSSVNGTRMFSTAGASAYAASKAGQLAFARMIALELAPAGVRVNTVCPGSTQTRIGESTRQRDLAQIKPAAVFPHGTVPLTPGRIGDPAQVANVIWFLSSPLASHVTGAEVFVDGGESLLRG